jgi:hypothetical protein
MQFGGSAMRNTSESFYDKAKHSMEYKVVKGLRKDISGP